MKRAMEIVGDVIAVASLFGALWGGMFIVAAFG